MDFDLPNPLHIKAPLQVATKSRGDTLQRRDKSKTKGKKEGKRRKQSHRIDLEDLEREVEYAMPRYVDTMVDTWSLVSETQTTFGCIHITL